MGLCFIDGRNSGYPCVPELSDVPDNYTYSHRFEFMLRTVPGRNSGYPSMSQIPELKRTAKILPPCPDFFMRCLGDGFNNGYPCILKLEGIRQQTFSNLFFGGKHISEMFFGDKSVLRAYCNGEKVYGTEYIKD